MGSWGIGKSWMLSLLLMRLLIPRGSVRAWGWLVSQVLKKTMIILAVIFFFQVLERIEFWSKKIECIDFIYPARFSLMIMGLQQVLFRSWEDSDRKNLHPHTYLFLLWRPWAGLLIGQCRVVLSMILRWVAEAETCWNFTSFFLILILFLIDYSLLLFEASL